MPIELSIEVGGAPTGLGTLMDRVAAACCEVEGIGLMDAAGRLVDDETIRTINREFRDIDRATDVLSFPSITYAPGKTAKDSLRKLRRERNPQSGNMVLGDFAISLKHARAQAAAYGHSLSRELGYLTAHSMFHLMGYDHEDEASRAVMRALEERAMAMVQLAREGAEQEMTDQELFDRACTALNGAYTPYSHYRVGACLLSTDGRTFDGCNIENASYGATICAERCAISCAVSQGATKFTTIAVVGERDPAWPCGICRQVLNEFSQELRVICGNAATGEYTVEPLTALLPHAFGPDNLNQDAP